MFWVFENDWRLWEPGHEPTAVKERLGRRFAVDELELDGDKQRQDEPASVDTRKNSDLPRSLGHVLHPRERKHRHVRLGGVGLLAGHHDDVDSGS